MIKDQHVCGLCACAKQNFMLGRSKHNLVKMIAHEQTHTHSGTLLLVPLKLKEYNLGSQTKFWICATRNGS